MEEIDKVRTNGIEQHEREETFRVVEYLTKRLDDTLRHNQVSTRNIYFVNGAILAAIYFTFGRQEFAEQWRFFIAAILSLLLAVVNWLHANFLRNQNSWYGAIDAQIREVFLTINGLPKVWPKALNDFRREFEKKADNDSNKYEKQVSRLLPFGRTYWTYPGIHVVMAVFLFLAFLFFGVAALIAWCRANIY